MYALLQHQERIRWLKSRLPILILCVSIFFRLASFTKRIDNSSVNYSQCFLHNLKNINKTIFINIYLTNNYNKSKLKTVAA